LRCYVELPLRFQLPDNTRERLPVSGKFMFSVPIACARSNNTRRFTMKLVKIAGTLGMGSGLVALMMWSTGCSSDQPAAPAQKETASVGDHVHAEGESADHDHAVEGADEKIEQDDDARIKAAFASLSPEDRALAMKQKVCPISGDPLGLMGTPIKVDVEGHEVFICCPGCKEPLLEDADAYLVKLGLKPAAE
jgi:hypothetical protein